MTIPSPAAQPDQEQRGSPRAGDSRWPMAVAVLTAGGLRAVLPAQLRNGDARWAFIVVVVALIAVLVIGDVAGRCEPWQTRPRSQT